MKKNAKFEFWRVEKKIPKSAKMPLIPFFWHCIYIEFVYWNKLTVPLRQNKIIFSLNTKKSRFDNLYQINIQIIKKDLSFVYLRYLNLMILVLLFEKYILILRSGIVIKTRVRPGNNKSTGPENGYSATRYQDTGYPVL